MNTLILRTISRWCSRFSPGRSTHLVRHIHSSLASIRQDGLRTTRMPTQYRRHVIHLVVEDEPCVVLRNTLSSQPSPWQFRNARTCLLCFANSSSENVFKSDLPLSLPCSSFGGTIHPPSPFPGATGCWNWTAGMEVSGSWTIFGRTRYHALLTSKT